MPEEYQPDPTLFDKLESFVFSAKILQYFCGTCGAHVIERSTTRDGPDSEVKTRFGIMPGTVKRLDGLCQFIGHIYVGDTRDGGLADFLPRYEGRELTRWAEYDTQDAKLSLYLQDEKSRQIEAQPADKLHAYCKCGGVDFWLKRAKRSLVEATADMKQPEPTDSDVICTPEQAAWTRAQSGKWLACNCVCDSCRSGAGQEITSWALVSTSDIWLDADGRKPFDRSFGTLSTYQSSPGHTRTFCSTCGAKVFYQTQKSDNTVDVAVGILDAAEGARANSWLEWQLQRVGYREDASGRSGDLLLALEEGVRDFVKASSA